MAHFDIAVDQQMTTPVHFIESDASLERAHDRLTTANISSLPVVDGDLAVGVISRSDLLRVGRRNAGNRKSADLLTFPSRSVGDEMTSGVVSVPPTTPVSEAARQMVEKRIHRVFIIDEGRLLGVISTRDIMMLIRDKKANAPISASMSTPIFKIRADDPISVATERLEKAKVSGLLVVDDDWPVGVFTQREALESSDEKRDTHVDEVMNPALVCLPHDTKIHRAAGSALAMRARRVVAVERREAVGILTGIDFASFAAA